MIRNAAALAASILILITLTGCWSRVEINDRAFVNVILVDLTEDGETELTLEFPLPNRLVSSQAAGTPPSGNPYATVTKRGVNMAEAFRRIQNDLSREITWGTVRVVVVGRSYAERGIRPMIEFLGRLPSIQLKTFVFVAEGRALDIIPLTPVFERFPSEVLREFANRQVTANATVRDFLRGGFYGGDAFAAMLKRSEPELLSEKGKKSPWVGTAGAALFRQDRMVGMITQKETRGVMWLTNRLRNALVTVPSPTDGKPVSVLVTRSQSKLRPRIKEDGITFELRIRALGHIISTDSNLKVMDPIWMGELERVVGEEIRQRILKAFARSQQWGADAYQLGEYVELYEPDKWKEVNGRWNDFYKNKVSLVIRTEFRNKRPGGEKDPVWVRSKP